MTRSSLCAVAALLLVGGCGNRGELYLPSDADDRQLEEDALLIEQAGPLVEELPAEDTIDADVAEDEDRDQDDDEEEETRRRRDGSVMDQPVDSEPAAE